MTSTPAPLTTQDLNRMAEAIENYAKTLRNEAQKLDDTLTRQMANQKMVNRLMSLGMEAARMHGWRKSKLDKRILATVFGHDCVMETAIHYTRKACDAEKARIRAQRNREIMRRARRGETNSLIAQATGVSTRTVSTVISETLRMRAALDPVEPKKHPYPPRRVTSASKIRGSSDARTQS